MTQIQDKQLKLAILNPYKSVVKINSKVQGLLAPLDTPKYLLGIKNTKTIPNALVDKLAENGFIFHTVDKMALGGRAIDIDLKNPVTGRMMTGSSSGTAINVFANINDIGIGTDGGGSVLAPAIALNLFAFISPLIERKNMEQFSKKSTDGITFSPSIGFITREFSLLKKAINVYIKLDYDKDVVTYIAPKDLIINNKFENKHKVIKIDYPDVLGEREELIKFLLKQLPNVDFLVTYEGPVDTKGYGDSIMGLYDENTKLEQRKGNKGLIRVANMANATAISIPDYKFACSYVLICESKEDKISKMIEFAQSITTKENLIARKYFDNLDMYF
ncbi:MAG: amidase family protein [Acholeplasma sp.]|nr:amidase family protein [Acholeplasma sp.]